MKTHASAPPGTPRAGYQRFIVLALITVILAVSTGDRATLSVAGPGIAKDLGINAVNMGWLFSAFSWSYFIAQVPSGYIVDRTGAKAAMLVSLAGWSIAITLVSGVGYFAYPVVALYVLRFVLGLLEGPVTPASARIIAAWFPSDERGVAGAIFNSAQYLSLAVFTPLMGALFHYLGWEHIFSVMGVIGLVLALVWWRAYFAPSRHPQVTKAEIAYIKAGGALTDVGGEKPKASEAQTPTRQIARQILTNRMLLGIFLAQYCIATLSTFFISWFPSYLVQERHFSMLQAGFVASLPAIFGCIGGVSTGFFSDWLLRKSGSLSLARKIPITIGLGLSATIILCNYTDVNAIVVAIMCAAFFGKGFGALGWTVVADTAPKEAIGLTGGLFNAAGSIGGVITPVAIGYIIEGTGSFHGALLYVGLHVIGAVVSYWVLVGKIERFEISKASFDPVGGELVLAKGDRDH
ncbi:MFS transporter [Rhizobium sp. IMFF44]|uniref:MFS transporter n=1 Tax=unclassified Rhizobium TaxID=2613769 RepID=UPI0035B6D041